MADSTRRGIQITCADPTGGQLEDMMDLPLRLGNFKVYGNGNEPGVPSTNIFFCLHMCV